LAPVVTSARTSEARIQPELAPPVLDVVVPVYDEQAALEQSIDRLRAHLVAHVPYSFRITIADNASTDATPLIARRLAARYPDVRSVRLEEKGRGRALSTVWSASDADVLVYMDVDLSTDLDGLLPLVAPLISGHSHVAIGTRLAQGSRVRRGAKRELISRCYNLILRGALATRISDAQCGFKAIRADVARVLLPHVADTGWFFDTELLVLAERSGLRVHEVPVDWIDDADSRVDIVSTAMADLRGVARLMGGLVSGAIPTRDIRRRLVPGDDPGPAFRHQVLWFGVIGVVSTIAYVALYALARTWLTPQGANLLALTATAIANTAMNRRLTFGVRGADSRMRHHAQGLVVFAVALAITSGALAGYHALAPDGSRSTELAVVIGANLVASIIRFVGLRTWIFARHRSAPTPNPAIGAAAAMTGVTTGDVQR
jgi:glycosyltransferase involved in cell wall biosynthesis